MSIFSTSLKRLLDVRIGLPGQQEFSRAIRSFSHSERIALLALLFFLSASTAAMLWAINGAFLVEVPAHGGTVHEGVVGSPRFVNPLLASSDADRDLTALVYSGLMRPMKNGALVPDLAESYEVSEDGLAYTFTLRKNASWHDGAPVTADDVVFTIQKAQDPVMRSPKRASWDGVKAKKVDAYTVQFLLSEPYAPFLENTTLGILPEHIWGHVTSEQFALSKFNIKPVGSGPYQIEEIRRDEGGIPEHYILEPFEHFTLGKPYINRIWFHFYANEETLLEAFADGEIENINSISPEIGAALAEEGYRVERSALPRVFGVFFNQNNAEIFTGGSVRRALDIAVDKQSIVDTVLHGYGTAINGPVPPGILGYTTAALPDLSPEERLAKARKMLERAGWKLDEETGVMFEDNAPLSFSLSTSAVPELKEVAAILEKQWGELGADVEVKIFEPGDLNQNVIRPREYDALLFGEIIGRDADPFAFWHSSQRLDPGLNIALYANITADALLEKARTIIVEQERAEQYEAFVEEVRDDMPAVFLYAPDFIYVLPRRVKNVRIDPVTIPSERFLNVHKWYIHTDRVWDIFVPENTSQ